MARPQKTAEVGAVHRTLLLDGAAQLGVSLSENQVDKLLEYLALLAKWNKTYNLSAIRDSVQMVGRHLLDSLSVVPCVQACGGKRIIDVGTGGGLPGIVLAIVFPDRHLTLLDSNGKKTRFLFQVKTQLQLDNVQIENRRVEEYQPDLRYSAVISRAFASLQDMTEGCEHLLTDDGLFLAMKGVYPTDELSGLEKRYKVSDSHQLQVPGEEGERHLLVLSREVQPREQPELASPTV